MTYNIEYSTVIEVEADDEDEALEKAWEEFNKALEEYGSSIFDTFNAETGKGY